MNILGRVAVFPAIPQRISRLYELAYNLWWTWHLEAQQLYADLDPVLWERVNHNPVRQLAEVAPERLRSLADDAAFAARYDAVLAAFDHYMHPETPTWFRTTYGSLSDKTVAYFSAEFGLHESLPIYSGGLGVLAGDHIKEASDLGLPFVGLGFLYPQGYFIQRIARDGTQEAYYQKVEFADLPATAAVDGDGKEVQISIELPGRRVYAKVWKLQIGRVPLYMLDTDVPGNAANDRELSARLYGGDQTIRISQEIMLGVGGLRAMRALGLDVSVIHLNDSHPVFAVLERCRELVGEGLDFVTASEVVRASTVFTTHTPVPAGNEVFNFDLIDQYFSNYWGQLGLSRDDFHNLARQTQTWGEAFSMTVLALRFSAMHNGVSALHGAVARRMWRFLWPGVNEGDVPITSVTNGVHTGTWLAPEIRALYDQYLPADWEERMDDGAQWAAVDKIPATELWQAHTVRKHKAIAYARTVLRAQRLRLGEGPAAIAETDTLLDPNALTIGFSRRFATYKRATLIMRDMERLVRLLHAPGKPVQIIYAGKSHPADEPGKELIKQVYTASRTPELAGHVVFLENYDMHTARMLVAGCDIWLNNPIRPHEASGTSGEKASLNGLPNCSILDGWWAEGYAPGNGWAIGEEREYQDVETQNAADAESLYHILEGDVIPAFFDRDADGIPQRWITLMKNAIRTLAPQFSMRRQVKDYTNKLYVPVMRRSSEFCTEHYAPARQLAAWKRKVLQSWEAVMVRVQGPEQQQFAVGGGLAVTAYVALGSMQPDDVVVELVGGNDENGVIHELSSVPLLAGEQSGGLYTYTGTLPINQGGTLVYGVRVVPTHPDLANKYELGLVRWA